MKLINILIAIISGFDFMDKERLTSLTQGTMYIILFLALSGVYVLFKFKFVELSI